MTADAQPESVGQPEVDAVLSAIATTRAIRRYRDEPVPTEVLNRILFAATRAPSGSNRQGFRFVVLGDDESSRRARAIVGDVARSLWATKRQADGYDEGSGVDLSSPKARLAAVLERYVERFESAPVVILACALRHRPGVEETIGASVYPACQNLLLAARALGYGGVLTTWQRACEPELRETLGIPADVFMAATITLGRPEGGHGPVRRRPLGELVYEGRWGATPDWIAEPDGTVHTSAGPPRRAP